MISRQEYMIFKNRLKYILDEDENHVDGKYLVSSLYFEDDYLSMYFDKVDGSKERYKYRLRTYNRDSSFIKFEKKIKSGSYIAKKTLRVDLEKFQKLYQRDYKFLFDEDFDTYNELHYAKLKPFVNISYNREAYLNKLLNVRVTFDHDLRYSFTDLNIFSNESHSRVFDEDLIIMEVKYDEIYPDYIRNIFDLERGCQTSISKYELAIKRENGGIIKW